MYLLPDFRGMQTPVAEGSERYGVGELAARTGRFLIRFLDVVLPFFAFEAVAGALLLGLVLVRPMWAAFLLFVLAAMAVTLWCYACVQWICLNAGSRPVGLADAHHAVWGTPLLRYAWTSFLVAVGTLCGLLLLIIPGVVFYCRYGLLAPAVVLAEGRSGIDALRRSRELAEGQRLISKFLLFLLIPVFIGLCAALVSIVFDSGVVEEMLLLPWSLAFQIWPALVYRRAASMSEVWVTEAGRQRPGMLSVVAAAVYLVAVTLSGSRVITEAFWLPSGSMMPTLEIGDHLLVNRLSYGLQLPVVGRLGPAFQPARGDIAVFESPNGGVLLMKRIIGLEGDEIEIRDKQLFLNGRPQEEPYAHHFDPRHGVEPRDEFGPVVVPPGKFFVLGDNRDHSHDSRYWGFADIDGLRGKAIYIYWSRPPEGYPRWDRIGREVG